MEAWYPSAPAARAVVDQWMDWNATKLTGHVSNVVLHGYFMGDKRVPALAEQGRAGLAEYVPMIEARLGEAPFLAGDHATIADLAVASNITQLGPVGEAPQVL